MNPTDHTLYKSIQNIQNQDDLDRCGLTLQQHFMVICGLSKHLKNLTLDEPLSRGLNKQMTKGQRVDLNNPSEIRGLYHQQEHRALQEILFGPSFFCKFENKKIEDHYKTLLSERSKSDISSLPSSLWEVPTSKENHDNILTAPFSTGEVRRKLSMKIYCKLSNSKSVGIDRLRFRDLLRSDPTCTFLTAFYNACLKLQSIPESWKETYSVLIKIPKNLEQDDPDIKKWKSVTMMNTIPKLFQALISSRLISWSKDTGLLSPMQKSTLLSRASCDSSFLLQECKKYAQVSNKDLSIAWLDFKDAGNSIPQDAFLFALQKHGVPEPIRNIIEKFIIGAKTKFKTRSDKGYTKSIEIFRGLPDGAPLNPILLDLVIEPILRGLDRSFEQKFLIYREKVNHFAIPEEITLIAGSQPELQNLLNHVEVSSKAIGLKFNINKCSTYHYNSQANRMESVKFTFLKQTLKSVCLDKIDEYFGVRQGLSIGQTDIPSVDETIDNVAAVSDSKLDEFQKLESIHTFILPRLDNCLRGLQHVDKRYLEQVDQILKSKIQNWLDLSNEASGESIAYHTYRMLEGKKDERRDNQSQKKNYILRAFIPLIDLFSIMKIVQAFEMLNSADKMLKQVAHDSLTHEVSKVCESSENNLTKRLASFLDGKCSVNQQNSTSLWMAAREATIFLTRKVSISWRFGNNTTQLYLKLDQTDSWKNCNKFKVGEEIKKALVQYYVQSVTSKSAGTVNK